MTGFTPTIGVVNGGGGCPGLSAVIRAVVRKAKLEHGWRVIGVANGFNGLIWPEQSKELTLESVCSILSRGGTILGTTNRGSPFAFPAEENGRTVTRDSSGQCIEGMKKFGIEALIVIGHVQRSGSPSPFDRILATRLGVFAVELVARGEYDRTVCLREGEIQSVPLADAIGATRLVDPASDYVRAARAVGISFGDRP